MFPRSKILSTWHAYSLSQLRFKSNYFIRHVSENEKYRKERGIPINPNTSGVLTDGSDFSYLDGRITPLAQGQRRRLLRNEEAKQQVIALSREIDFAVERYEQLQVEESRKKQEILNRKLKPKGATLLKSS